MDAQRSSSAHSSFCVWRKVLALPVQGSSGFWVLSFFVSTHRRCMLQIILPRHLIYIISRPQFQAPGLIWASFHFLRLSHSHRIVLLCPASTPGQYYTTFPLVTSSLLISPPYTFCFALSCFSLFSFSFFFYYFPNLLPFHPQSPIPYQG